MDLFGFAPDNVAARVRSSSASERLPTLNESLLIAGVGFCLASLLVFATVAFGERWMYRNLGLYGAYGAWTALFILAGGAALSPLIIDPDKWARFYMLWGVAFFLYAAGWVAAYFTLKNLLGEYLGLFIGAVLMVAIFAHAFKTGEGLPKMIAALFAANAAGYFIGSLVYSAQGGRVGMIGWGAFYGLGMGLGLGYALYRAQSPVRARLGT